MKHASAHAAVPGRGTVSGGRHQSPCVASAEALFGSPCHPAGLHQPWSLSAAAVLPPDCSCPLLPWLSINQSVHQSISQPASQSVNQSINQSVNKFGQVLLIMSGLCVTWHPATRGSRAMNLQLWIAALMHIALQQVMRCKDSATVLPICSCRQQLA